MQYVLDMVPAPLGWEGPPNTEVGMVGRTSHSYVTSLTCSVRNLGMRAQMQAFFHTSMRPPLCTLPGCRVSTRCTAAVSAPSKSRGWLLVCATRFASWYERLGCRRRGLHKQLCLVGQQT